MSHDNVTFKCAKSSCNAVFVRTKSMISVDHFLAFKEQYYINKIRILVGIIKQIMTSLR